MVTASLTLWLTLVITAPPAYHGPTGGDVLDERLVASALRVAIDDGVVAPPTFGHPHIGALVDLAQSLPAHGASAPDGVEGRLEQAYQDALVGAPVAVEPVAQSFAQLFSALGLLDATDGETQNEAARRAALRFLGSDDPEAFVFNALPPPGGEYGALQAALVFYRRLEEHGGFASLPKTVMKARPQKEHPAVAALRARLRQEDALSCSATCAQGPDAVAADGDPLFGDDVVDALRRARERYQLEPRDRPSGLLDRALLAELNVSASSRRQALERALRVVRRSPRFNFGYHVRVNLPEFLLRVVDRGSEVARHAVIVGKPSGAGMVNATPTVVSRIRSVVFNPRWVVPSRIFRKEMEAAYADDLPPESDSAAYEAFWADKGYDVHGRTERSRYLELPPGPKNPLGKVKLIFENRNSVYLHDTPSKRLFSATRRAFSHGCLRLQDPVGLAELLLRHDGTWGDVLDAGALGHWRETPVALIRPVPLTIEYQVASAGPDGVRFFWDVYSRSRRYDG